MLHLVHGEDQETLLLFPSPTDFDSEEVENEKPLADPQRGFLAYFNVGDYLDIQLSKPCNYKDMENDHRSKYDIGSPGGLQAFYLILEAPFSDMDPWAETKCAMFQLFVHPQASPKLPEMDCRSRGQTLRVEDYWVCQIELITAIKEGVIMNMTSVQVDDSLDTKPGSLLAKLLPMEGQISSH